MTDELDWLWSLVDTDDFDDNEKQRVADIIATARADRAFVTRFLPDVSDLIGGFNQLHRVYANTTACYGGIGGQTLTPHCGVTCENPVHDAAIDRMERAMRSISDAITEVARAERD